MDHKLACNIIDADMAKTNVSVPKMPKNSLNLVSVNPITNKTAHKNCSKKLKETNAKQTKEISFNFFLFKWRNKLSMQWKTKKKK